MRTFGKWLGRIILMLILAAVVVGLWKREEIVRLMAVNSLFSEEKIVHNFSHMGDAFLTTPVDRGQGPTSDLPYGQDATLPASVTDYITDRSVTSLLVMKRGEIVHESYYLDTGADDLRISWSVAKSYLATLFGVLKDEGVFDSLDDPVTKYAPSLKGSAYDGASIRNVLNMSSGVVFDENYLDYDSDINRMGRVIALGGELDDFAASLKDTFVAPGTEWQYVSIDTHVIGMVVRGATGRSIPDLLSEKVIAPLGLERSPSYITDGAGVAFVLGGLNITTRDYARFGQMIEQGGEYNGKRIVSAEWVSEAVKPTAPTAPDQKGYGYQWWIPQDPDPGEFAAQGVYGQYIYIDQPRDVVIVITAADRGFRQEGVTDHSIAILREIARSL